MTFSIKVDRQPEDFLKKAERKLQERLIKKIEALKQDPIPHDAKRVVNRKEKVFRVRVGDYRILYVVYLKENTILLSKIDKRSTAYK